jgi:hypothetical protein
MPSEQRVSFMFCTDGTVQSEDCLLLELEDVAKVYKRPSIIDIKVPLQMTGCHGIEFEAAWH